MSLAFIAFYGAALLVLVIYSLLWQRILAKMPLTTAFSNKGITIIWGIVWGAVIFDEKITVAKVLAAIFIVSGIAVIGKAES
jgi:drug/metabolite transporter (DMT)-like permease